MVKWGLDIPKREESQQKVKAALPLFEVRRFGYGLRLQSTWVALFAAKAQLQGIARGSRFLLRPRTVRRDSTFV
jgi:hypothetical protein